MSRILRNSVVVPILLGLLFALLNWPAAQQFSISSFGGSRGDAAIYLYLLEENARSFFTIPSRLFDASFFHPFGQSLAYTDNFLLPGLVAKPLLAVGVPLVAAYNLILFGVTVLNGYLTFRLARALQNSQTASFVAAVAFSFCCFLSSQWVHPQLQFVFVFPAAYLSVLRFFEKRSWFSASCIGMTVAIGFLTSMYYGFFCALFLMVLGIGIVLLKPSIVSLRNVIIVLFANLPWFFLVLWLSVQYKAVRTAFGGRSLYEAKFYSGSLGSFFSTAKNNYLWGDVLHQFGHYESRLFPGLTAIALLLILVFSRRGLRSAFALLPKQYARALAVCGVLATTATFVAIGSSFVFSEWLAEKHTHRALLIAVPQWGILFCGMLALRGLGRGSRESERLAAHELLILTGFITFVFIFATQGIIGGHWPKAVRPGFFYQLYRYIPGFDAIRAAGRIGVLAAFGLSLLTGYGYSILESKPLFQRRPWLARVLACVVLALLCLELKHTDFPLQPEPETPPVYDYLSTLPGDEAVIALPFGIVTNVPRYTLLQTDYMRNLQRSGRRMVNGYSGKMPAYQQFLEKKTKGFPDQLSVSYLGRIADLRYLVFDRRYAEQFDEQDFEQRMTALGDQLKLLQKDSWGNYLFELRPLLTVDNLELYLRPDLQSPRNVRIRFQLEGYEESDLPIVLEVQTGTRPEGRVKTPVMQKVELHRLNAWQEVELSLPISISPVIPHKVRFITPTRAGGQKILVKRGAEEPLEP